MTGLRIERKPAGDAPGVSGLDELRSVFEAIDDREQQTELFDVEGTNAVVRYRRMLQEDRLAIAPRARELDPRVREWEINAQFLIDACDEILIRDPVSGVVGPLVDGKVVTFAIDPARGTLALAQALGVQEPDVRRAALRLFRGVDDALLRHAQQVDGWMRSVRAKVEDAFAGGS